MFPHPDLDSYLSNKHDSKGRQTLRMKPTWEKTIFLRKYNFDIYHQFNDAAVLTSRSQILTVIQISLSH